jgi:choline dehydrogenase-like flavoprotein
MNDGTYDYIIVGSGAGGCAAAYRLAEGGGRVLVVEKGPMLPADGSTLDLEKVLRHGLFKNREPWVDGRGRSVLPEEYFNVGGKTKWYGAALLRFRPHEFVEDRQHQCPGWPIGYEDMAPFYDEAEQLLAVRHFPVEANLRAMLSRLQRRDPRWHEYPMPIGLAADILSHPEEASRFDGYASVLRLKSDGQGLLERIQERANVRIVTGNAVVALIGSSGDPRTVVGVRLADGAEHRAGAVLLAAGAMHSPRLLQTYVEEQGIAAELPSYPVIGRNFKTHLNSILIAFGARRRTDVLCKTALLRHDAYPHSIVQALGGGIVADIILTQAPGFSPRWLSAAMGRHSYGFFLTTEDGSHPDNRVAARADGDRRPLMDFDASRLPVALTEHRGFVAAFQRGLLRLGMASVARLMPAEATAHACGTLMAGRDPAHSVVDGAGKVHGLEGLYVVDGSILPRSGGVNPALTIYAWGLRVGAALAAQPMPAEEAVA